MQYLKCNNCDHFNEVNTEYLTFCTNCSKKLANNYPDWLKRNPDRSFEDFKHLFCTTEKLDVPVNPPKSKNGKGLKVWIAFALAFAIFFAIGKMGGEKLAGMFKKPAFDKVLMETASEINKSCPIMIDSETRLDNTIALPGNVFQYNYTLVNLLKDSINLDEFKSYMEPTIINFVRTNPEMLEFRNKKVIVNYYYKDKTGVYLYTISVKPEHYE